MSFSSSKSFGLLCAIIGAAVYGLNPLFVLPLYKEGLTIWTVLLYRFALAALLTLGIVFARKSSLRVPRALWLPLGTAGLLMGATSLMLYMGYIMMDAGIASTILFTYPVMVSAIMAGVFKERIPWQIVVCIAVSLLGVAILQCGGAHARVSWLGSGVMLLSALFWALYLIIIQKSAINTLPTDVLSFYCMAIAALLFLIPLRGGLDLQLPKTFMAYLNFAGLATIPTILAVTCVTKGVALIGSTPSAILGALEPMTAVIIGVCVFHEPFTLSLMTGIILIVLAVVCVILHQASVNRKSQKNITL